MSIIGEAFVQVSPESEAFAGKLESQLKSGLSSVGLSNLGALAGVGFAAAFGAALFKIGEDFHQVRVQIERETGATGQTLTGLADSVTTVFQQVPTSLGNVTAAVDELFRRGTAVGPVLDTLARKETELAKITGSDVAGTVDTTTALFAKFGIATRDQSRELDVLFKASQQSGRGLSDLIGNVTVGASALQQFGFSLDQSVSLIANLEKAGVTVTAVLAGLRKGFAQVAKEGGDPQAVLASLIKEFTDGTPKTRAMADAIKLFGTRAGTELATAIEKGKFNVDALLKTITNGKGGIDATAASTRTLGETFTLIRNKAEVALSGLGEDVFAAVQGAVKGAEKPVEDFAKAVADTTRALAPALIPVGAVIEGVFRAAGPALTLFSTGLEAIDSVLGHFPPVAIAAAAAAGTLFLVFRSIGGTAGDVAAGFELIGESAGAFLLNPVTLAVVAIAALGLAVEAFGHHADNAGKEAKDFGSFLIDTTDGANTFKAGITSATTAFQQFLVAQTAGGKQKGLQATLDASGSSVKTLVSQLGAGSAAWDSYVRRTSIAAATEEVTNGTIRASRAELKQLLTQTDANNARQAVFNTIQGKAAQAIDQQRVALEKQAKTFLTNVETSGQLSKATVDSIVKTNTAADGWVNYGKVLDQVNAKVLTANARASDLSDQLNKQVAATQSVKLGDVAKQYADGAISAADYTAALANLGVDSAAAKTETDSLTQAIKSFNDAVAKGAPGVDSAISDVGGTIGKDQQALTAALITQASLQRQVAADGGHASKALADAVKANNADIAKSFQQLALDNDPQKFVDELLRTAGSVAAFTTNLKTLTSEGFGALAGQLAQAGVVAGGALASAFASDKTKAAAADNAARIADGAKNGLLAFTKAHAGELGAAGDEFGTAFGAGVASGVAKGQAAALLEASGLGEKVVDSLLSIPVDAAGAAIPAGLATGIDRNKAVAILTASGLKQAAIDQLLGAGPAAAGAGAAFGQGFADGISAKDAAAIQASTILGDKAHQALITAINSHSPSKLTFQVGTFFAQGFADGIDATADVVIRAVGRLAKASTDTLAKVGAPATNVRIEPGATSTATNDTRRPPGDPPTKQIGPITFAHTFNEQVDPEHVSSDIAWKLTHL